MVYRDALLSVAAYASLGGSVAKTFFARADNTASYAGRLNMESLESSSWQKVAKKYSELYSSLVKK